MTAPSPTLAANVMHFARLLRRAGLPVGPAETLAGKQALTLVNLGSRTEARTALLSVVRSSGDENPAFGAVPPHGGRPRAGP